MVDSAVILQGALESTTYKKAVTN